MMKKLMLLCLLVIPVLVAAFSEPTYAHFIVEDDTTGVKALFHVTPNHNPVAGRDSVISFDFANTEYQAKDFSYVLMVKSTKGEAVKVPFEVSSNVILSTYTFPSQGFYNISLTATSLKDGAVSKLQYGQRVSRGVVVQQENKLGTAEISAIVGAIAIAAVGVIFGLISDSKARKGKKK
jgi:hypothetical protein